jgi:hypothetical protein
MFVQEFQSTGDVVSDEPHILSLFLRRGDIGQTYMIFKQSWADLLLGGTNFMQIPDIIMQCKLAESHVDKVNTSLTSEPAMVPNIDDICVSANLDQGRDDTSLVFDNFFGRIINVDKLPRNCL